MPYLTNEHGEPVWLCYYPSPECEVLETNYQPYANQGLTSFITGDDNAIMVEFTPPLAIKDLPVFTYCPDVSITHVDAWINQMKRDIAEMGEPSPLSPVDAMVIYSATVVVWVAIISGIVKLFVAMLNRLGG